MSKPSADYPADAKA